MDFGRHLVKLDLEVLHLRLQLEYVLLFLLDLSGLHLDEATSIGFSLRGCFLQLGELGHEAGVHCREVLDP
jgi:hypothetical protein